ncbi:unnamed protein product [Phytomonas sp. Hart1]|nr:unnamed protein product [Phytomonas sp. Hart1]|eukprot:CCW68530.1 unnamed protein product [Phytomonas sp. isolate Hart1]
MSWRCVAKNTYLCSYISFSENHFMYFYPIYRNYSTFARNGKGCFHHSSIWRHPSDSFTNKTRAVLFSGTSGSKSTEEKLHLKISNSPIRRQQQRTETFNCKSHCNTEKPSANSNVHNTFHIPSNGQYAKPQKTIGRFNRVVAEKGLSFAVYLYILGESFTLFLTYCLHTNQFCIGEVGVWLSGIGLKGVVESYLDMGPVVFNTYHLSLRLFLNYLIVNIFTFSLFSYEVAFCMLTAPILSKLVLPVRTLLKKWKKSKNSAIPKAPSPFSGS